MKRIHLFYTLHEGSIEEMYRLYVDCLYRQDGKVLVDRHGSISIDDWEM